jgi:hypothetical protein
MKRLLTLIFLAAFSTGAFAQTADEVIGKFIEATGGKERLNAVNTLQYSQLIKLKTPMGDLDVPMKYYREKNKLFRTETSLQFGPQTMNFFTVINDTAGYVMMPANPMMGSEGGLEKLSAKDHALQVGNMDASGLFSSLVDYATKGHKVELLKDEKVNKEDCYKIKHTFVNGQEIVYLINKSTNLIVRADAKGTMAATQTGLGGLMNSMGGGGRADKMEVSTLYADYKEFDGIKIPVKLTIKSPMGDLESEITNVQVNKPINPALYKAQ